MIKISHRGNIKGPNMDRENRPSYIDAALQLGYDVEVDIRLIDNEFWLGHDTPDYKISQTWIMKRKNNIWFHCKDLYSAQKFIEMDCEIKFFCHSSDSFVLTSTNHIWVHDLDLNLNNTCIVPLLEDTTIEGFKEKNVHAVCLDNISLFEIQSKYE